jgi:hypothetical protein
MVPGTNRSDPPCGILVRHYLCGHLTTCIKGITGHVCAVVDRHVEAIAAILGVFNTSYTATYERCLHASIANWAMHTHNGSHCLHLRCKVTTGGMTQHYAAFVQRIGA